MYLSKNGLTDMIFEALQNFQGKRLKSLKMGIIPSALAKTDIKILPIHHFAQILRDGILKKRLFSVRH